MDRTTLKAELTAVSEAHGVPFVMPTSDQILAAGKEGLIAEVAANGGPMKVTEFTGLAAVPPRMTAGKLNFKRRAPGNGLGWVPPLW